MHPLSLLALIILSSFAPAQTVTEETSLSVRHSRIDMDALPLGPTDVNALNAAGDGGGANLAGLQLFPSSATSGTYDVNTCGFALAARENSGGSDPVILSGRGGARFDSYSIRLDLGAASTEFGLMMGDWGGTAILDFYRSGVLVSSYETTTLLQCTPQFYRMAGADFDRVEIDVAQAGGNFVLLELYLEKAAPVLQLHGLQAGQLATLTVQECTPGGTVRAGYSLNGAGPTATIYGDLLLGFPYRELPLMVADAAGVATQSVNVPPAAVGIPIWAHAFDVASTSFSNGFAEQIR